MSEFKCEACGQGDYCICSGRLPIVHSGGNVTYINTYDLPKCARCSQSTFLGQCSNPYCELAHLRAKVERLRVVEQHMNECQELLGVNDNNSLAHAIKQLLKRVQKEARR
jgi:hypothetical protein